MALSKVDLANQVENQLPQSLVADNVNFRNILINGDMSIAQRGTSFSSVSAGNGTYPVDRFRNNMGTAGTWTISQDTDVPSGQGFATSVKYDCTTANASLSAGSFLIFEQQVEGQNLQYLKKGTANAESLTLSFWVKSNKTGTYIAELYDNDNTRQISQAYTISSASTWEKKTITYAGDTTGAFGNDNGASLRLFLWLAAGSNYTSGTLNTSWNTTAVSNRVVGQVNLADDTANEWYITGVQLEAGTTASDFEFLPYDVNLARCQRYYQLIAQGASSPINTGFAYSSSQVSAYITLITSMRATPTLDMVSGTDYYRFTANATNTNFNVLSLDIGNTRAVTVFKGSLSGLTGGQAGFINAINASSYIALASEL